MVTEDGEEKPTLVFSTLIEDDEEVDFNPYLHFLRLHTNYIQGVDGHVNYMIKFIRELIELEKSNGSEVDNTFKRLLSKLSNASKILLKHHGESYDWNKDNWNVGEDGDLGSVKACIAVVLAHFDEEYFKEYTEQQGGFEDLLDQGSQLDKLRQEYERLWSQDHIWILLNFYRDWCPFFMLRTRVNGEKFYDPMIPRKAMSLMCFEAFGGYMMVCAYSQSYCN